MSDSHHHHHHQHHEHQATADKEHDKFAAANEAHFDASAEANDLRPEWKKLAQDAVEVILKAYPTLFEKEKTEVLDFACGTGMPVAHETENIAVC